MPAPRPRIAAFIGLLACAAFARAEIDYDVSVRNGPASKVLHVEMTIPTAGGPLTLQSPRWAPGSYDYGDFGKSIERFAATDAKGAPLEFAHPDFSTWTIDAPKGAVKVDYEYPVNVFQDEVHYSGPRTYLYVVDRKQEKCGLKIELPEGWKVRMGLDPVGRATDAFTAPTYDVLADTPVTMGKFREATYVSHGKPHYVVMYGIGQDAIDVKALVNICKFTSDAEGNFFGEVPYKRYVWHFNVSMGGRDGGSGLEHLNGTEISLGTGVGPSAQSVITHEFFHLWNVKRIRAKVLGPFDYTTLPKTGALWWLEGVTDYYAIMIPSRYGWWGTDMTYRFMARNIQSTEANPRRTEISPYDSSYRVDEANNGRGNSNGLYVSYYNEGWLCGFMLDTEIRLHSGGKHSLDDVELALWNLCKNNKPGFAEDEIRKLVVRYGGPELGPMFDKWVMQPGDLPVEAELAKLGLVYTDDTQTVAEFPFTAVATPSDGGFSIPEDEDSRFAKEIVTSVGGEAAPAGDVAAMQRWLAGVLGRSKPGDRVTIVVRCTDAKGTETTETRSVKLLPQRRRQVSVAESPTATPEQLALRKAWLSPRPGTKAVSATPLQPPVQ